MKRFSYIAALCGVAVFFWAVGALSQPAVGPATADVTATLSGTSDFNLLQIASEALGNSFVGTAGSPARTGAIQVGGVDDDGNFQYLPLIDLPATVNVNNTWYVPISGAVMSSGVRTPLPIVQDGVPGQVYGLPMYGAGDGTVYRVLPVYEPGETPDDGVVAAATDDGGLATQVLSDPDGRLRAGTNNFVPSVLRSYTTDVSGDIDVSGDSSWPTGGCERLVVWNESDTAMCINLDGSFGGDGAECLRISATTGSKPEQVIEGLGGTDTVSIHADGSAASKVVFAECYGGRS